MPLEGMLWAVGCTWPEIAVPKSRLGRGVHARAPDGRSGEVLQPLDESIAAMCLAIHRAKEPLLSNAAFAFVGLLEQHATIVAESVRRLAQGEHPRKARDVIDALLGRIESSGTLRRPRVITFSASVLGSGTGKPKMPCFIYHGDFEARVRLTERIPEEPLSEEEAATGMKAVLEVCRAHRDELRSMLGLRPGESLRHGFHPNASLSQVEQSFRQDGFEAVRLKLPQDLVD